MFGYNLNVRQHQGSSNVYKKFLTINTPNKMKQISTLVSIAAIYVLSSCAATVQPIKGKYQEGPYSVTTTKTKDQVWESIIDLFSSKGISIRTMDRQSGLIVSDRTNFINSYTTEDGDGKLKNPAAYVVVDKQKAASGINMFPGVVRGDWNVRIKEQDGKTLININLVNVEAFLAGSSTYGPYRFDFNSKSTGNFEKMIADEIVK